MTQIVSTEIWSFDIFFDLRLKNDWVNNREASDLKRYRAHDDVIVMNSSQSWLTTSNIAVMQFKWIAGVN